jgi:hypothetical protein
MCTVSVEVNEKVLRDDAADMKFSRDMTPEELYCVIEQDIRAIYADESN